ncbi:MAG: hypothetical protein ACREMN_11060, partial [Gemmatimonadales bacterium]
MAAGAARAPAAQGLHYRVTTDDTWFHQEAGGRRLARLMRGATFAAADASPRDGWVQLTLDGWIWSASVDSSPRPDFDLLVTRDREENLRASAGGTIVAKLAEGFGLHRVGAADAGARWVHV